MGKKVVTKKLVVEALTDIFGWGFCYDFRESQSLYLLSNGNADSIKSCLDAHGVKVTKFTPCEPPITGAMNLAMKEGS